MVLGSQQSYQQNIDKILLNHRVMYFYFGDAFQSDNQKTTWRTKVRTRISSMPTWKHFCSGVDRTILGLGGKPGLQGGSLFNAIVELVADEDLAPGEVGGGAEIHFQERELAGEEQEKNSSGMGVRSAERVRPPVPG
jgi:hypothetical protein